MPTHKRDVERFKRKGENTPYTLCGKPVFRGSVRLIRKAPIPNSPITCYSCYLEAKKQGIEIRSPFNA